MLDALGSHSWLPGGHEIGAYEHLLQRVDPKQLDALFEPATATKPEVKPTAKRDDRRFDDAGESRAEAEADAPSLKSRSRISPSIDLRIAQESWPPKPSRVRTSCSNSHSTWARASAPCSPASAPRKPEQLVGRFTLVLANLSLARCASGHPREWCWPPARAAKRSSCSRPMRRDRRHEGEITLAAAPLIPCPRSCSSCSVPSS